MTRADVPSVEASATEGGTDPIFDPISYTAIKIVEQRARLTSILYAREMADALGVHWRDSGAREWARRILWGSIRGGRYLQFRFEAISKALEVYPGSAVLEIAAGFNTRGLAECSAREAYIESDLLPVIRRKPRLIEVIRGSPPERNHHFVALNACYASDMERVGVMIDGMGLNKPVVIIHEGLLIYLNDREQAQVRDNIKVFLSKHTPRGAWITTDFSERDSDQTMWQRLQTRRLARRIHRHFNRFPDDRSVIGFLSEAGFSIERLPSPSADDLDEEVREVAGRFRAWMITLG
jgi:O-methyltransferase involved in polyketide biosynthesis